MKLMKNKKEKETFGIFPDLLTKDSNISNDAKILWYRLYNSNNGKKPYEEWKPTIKGLATIFNVSKITIKRWKKELDDSGWISTIGSRNNTTIIINFTPIVGIK